MKSERLAVAGRLGLSLSGILLFCMGFVYVLSLSIGGWIVCRFGQIPAWLIVSHMFESPAVLPVKDILLLALGIAAALGFALVSTRLYLAAGRRIRIRYGRCAAVGFSVAVFAVMAYASWGAFDILDVWFAIRHEIACRRVRSDYFAKNFHRTDPSSVVFPEKRKNLIVIISESLEEGFTEGALGGENLLPGLVKWREGGFRADTQCQIAGASFTSAALTSLFYGIPRLRLDGSVNLQDTEHYPRFSIPSIWDVFLTNGYACAYVQGGTYEFGSKGRLFPESGDFRRLGFDNMREDPDYLAEADKPHFGVNDEVMFKYLKTETERMAEGSKPFVLFALTLNVHCPIGWCSSLAPRGDRGTLAESVLAQDRMICDYLEWLGKRKYDSDTVVIVLGDHYYWGRKFVGTSARRVFNAVRVPGADTTPFRRSRRFSAVDWAPTFIELTGGTLPGDGHFGMGVSLLRETKTVLEDIEESRFDDEMQSSLADYWDIVLER